VEVKIIIFKLAPMIYLATGMDINQKSVANVVGNMDIKQYFITVMEETIIKKKLH